MNLHYFKRPIALRFGLLLIFTIASVLATLSFGSADISLENIKDCFLNECRDPIYELVLWDIRLPRVLLGLVAGMSLAIAGCLLQNTTRNPLADPYLFGIVSGAGLGATLYSFLPFEEISIGLPVAAFIGAIVSVCVVMLVVLSTGWRRMEHMLLAGVAVSFMFSSITSFLLYFGEAFATNRVIFWLMGSLARADHSALMIIIPVLIVTVIVALAYSRQLDALLLSDESAKTLGINVNALRLFILLICAALTAVVVAYCGGISFVGLMIPHMIRPLFGVTNSKLILASGLAGGCFLVWVDVIARAGLAGQELPIGVITSAMGSVFFLLLMRKM